MFESSPLFRRALLAASLSLALFASACSGERPELADEPVSTTTTERESTTTTAPEPVAEVAQAQGKSIDVFDSADAGEPAR